MSALYRAKKIMGFLWSKEHIYIFLGHGEVIMDKQKRLIAYEKYIYFYLK